MVGMITRNGIIVKQGDSFDIVMQFKDKNKKCVDLTGCKITMNVESREKKGLLFKIDADIISEKEGKAIIYIKPVHTNITPMDYDADIQIVLKNGDVHTIFPQDITKSAVFKITESATGV